MYCIVSQKFDQYTALLKTVNFYNGKYDKIFNTLYALKNGVFLLFLDIHLNNFFIIRDKSSNYLSGRKRSINQDYYWYILI